MRLWAWHDDMVSSLWLWWFSYWLWSAPRWKLICRLSTTLTSDGSAVTSSTIRHKLLTGISPPIKSKYPRFDQFYWKQQKCIQYNIWNHYHEGELIYTFERLIAIKYLSEYFAHYVMKKVVSTTQEQYYWYLNKHFCKEKLQGLIDLGFNSSPLCNPLIQLFE